MNNIELRDYFAGQVITNLGNYNCAAHRENIAKEGELENWVQVSAEEATKRHIEWQAKIAYTVADIMIQVREYAKLH